MSNAKEPLRSAYIDFPELYDSALTYVREHEDLQKVAFVGPITAFLVSLFILPVIYMTYVSFTSTFPGLTLDLTLSNYIDIFTTGAYIEVTVRTLVLTMQTLVLVIGLGYAMAYGVAMFGKHKSLLLTLIVLPFWINYLVRNYAIIGLFQGGGPFEILVTTLGLTAPEVLYTRTAVLIGLVYSFLPVALLPMYASIARMDKSLIAASKDLGAGPIKTFYNVTLPETKDGIVVGGLLVAIPTFGAFVTPAMLGGPDDNMIGTLIEHQFMSVYNIPFGASLGVMTMVATLSIIGVLFVVNGVPMLNNE